MSRERREVLTVAAMREKRHARTRELAVRDLAAARDQLVSALGGQSAAEIARCRARVASLEQALKRLDSRSSSRSGGVA